MDKIQPLTFVTDTDPVPEEILDASGWFQTEYIVIDYPTHSDDAQSYLEWYLAQGWIMYDTYGFGSGRQARLRRRKLQSELVLQDLITEFTDAHNSGREINDQRYDEIVAIYNKALDKTEDEINSLEDDSDAFDTLIDTYLDEIPDDIDDLVERLDGILDDFGTARRTEIASEFDSQQTRATQALIDSGLNNTTIANSVTLGLAREEQRALTDFEDTLVSRKAEIYLALVKLRQDLRLGLIDAHNRWIKMKQDNRLTPLQFRNTVLMAMLNFMERRTDSYPGLEGLASIASQLGYSEGEAVVAPTS